MEGFHLEPVVMISTWLEGNSRLPVRRTFSKSGRAAAGRASSPARK